jgi:hypothetical protein
MRNKLYLFYALLLILLTNAVSAQKLIHYWHFNNLASGTLTTVNPDSSLVSGANITYPGTGAGYLDNVNPGSSENTRYSTAVGLGLRPRNPSDTRYFLMAVPTTGFEKIVIKFATAKTTQGATDQNYEYTVDGTNWITTGLSKTNHKPSTEPTFDLVTLDFSAISSVNNNSKFAVRIAFGGTTASGSSGNNRFDNITVDGSAPGSGATPPDLTKASFIDSVTIKAEFNTIITNATATNSGNYSITPSIAVKSVSWDSTAKTATVLLNSRAQNGLAYSLKVNNLITNAGGTMSDPDSIKGLLYNDFSKAGLNITEINYNSPSGDPDTLDFIEIYNNSGAAIPLGGLRLHTGQFFTFPQISLANNSFLLVGHDSAKCRKYYGKPFLQYLDALSNGGEALKIVNSLNQIVDSVNYDDATPWPLGPPSPDGGGPSLEIIDVTKDNNVSTNWKTSITAQGTVNGVAVFASPGNFGNIPTVPGIAFSTATTNTPENIDSASIVFNITNSNLSPITMKLNLVTGGTASQGTDFNFASRRLTIPANTSTFTYKIKVNDDASSEAAEYFYLKLDSATNANIGSINQQLVFIKDNDLQAPKGFNNLNLQLLTSYNHSVTNGNSAEIVKYDALSKRLFIANSIAGKIDIVDFRNPAAPKPIRSINIKTYGNINSIAVKNGLVAAAIENTVPESNGFIAFFDTAGTFIKQVTAGAMPDDISFSPDGKKILTANEGQPETNYTIDPEGSITVVDISVGISALTQANVKTIYFRHFNKDSTNYKNLGVRIFGIKATLSQDMEPEFISYSDDSKKAYVSLQENNAIGLIDLQLDSITAIWPLGYKDHSAPRNGMDASDQGVEVNIANWPVKGMYMPDALASYTVGGVNYIVSANEGDAREYNALEEETTVGNAAYILDPVKFPNASFLKNNLALGRLAVTEKNGDTDGDGDFDEIYAFGGRSFTIWNGNTGAKVYDSGDQLEVITSTHPIYAPLFNANNSAGTPSKKNRSDNKGPEPEGVVTAKINDTTYAFIALERTGGCIVFDISNPLAPRYVQFIVNRNLTSGGVDLGAEGIVFIDKYESPNGKHLVLLANEVSSTISVFQVNSANMPPSKVSFVGAKTEVFESVNERKIMLSIKPKAETNSKVVIAVTNGNFVNDSDYYSVPSVIKDSIVLNIRKNDTTAFISVFPINDQRVEIDETVSFEIRSTGIALTPGNRNFSFTIINDDQPLSVNNLEGNRTQLKVYPNPNSTGVLNFNKNVTLEIFDYTGKVIQTGTKVTQLDISNLSKGIYYLKTSEGETKKFMVQ